MNKLCYIALTLSLTTACVSNKSVSRVQVGDGEKSCQALLLELSQLGARFENVKDDSGVTGKNVGLAIVFWPGIIVNEVRSGKNEESVDSRISYLNGIYNNKCVGEKAAGKRQGAGQSLKEKLIDLRTMLYDGLLTENEYKAAKKKLLEAD